MGMIAMGYTHNPFLRVLSAIFFAFLLNELKRFASLLKMSFNFLFPKYVFKNNR